MTKNITRRLLSTFILALISVSSFAAWNGVSPYFFGWVFVGESVADGEYYLVTIGRQDPAAQNFAKNDNKVVNPLNNPSVWTVASTGSENVYSVKCGTVNFGSNANRYFQKSNETGSQGGYYLRVNNSGGNYAYIASGNINNTGNTGTASETSTWYLISPTNYALFKAYFDKAYELHKYGTVNVNSKDNIIDATANTKIVCAEHKAAAQKAQRITNGLSGNTTGMTADQKSAIEKIKDFDFTISGGWDYYAALTSMTMNEVNAVVDAVSYSCSKCSEKYGELSSKLTKYQQRLLNRRYSTRLKNRLTAKLAGRDNVAAMSHDDIENMLDEIENDPEWQEIEDEFDDEDNAMIGDLSNVVFYRYDASGNVHYLGGNSTTNNASATDVTYAYRVAFNVATSAEGISTLQVQSNTNYYLLRPNAPTNTASVAQFSTTNTARRQFYLQLANEEGGVYIIPTNATDGTALGIYNTNNYNSTSTIVSGDAIIWYVAPANYVEILLEVSGLAQLGTFVAQDDVRMVDNVTAYQIGSVDASGKMSLNKVCAPGQTLAAGTPVIVKNETGTTIKHIYVVEDGPHTDSHSDGFLHGNYDKTDIPVGNYLLQYQSMNKGSEVGFYEIKVKDLPYTFTDVDGIDHDLTGTGPLALQKNRCYLAMPSDAKRRLYYNMFDYVDTGDIALPIGSYPMEDGSSDADQGIIYDLMGRRVAVVSKGIFIKNGKKFIVR